MAFVKLDCGLLDSTLWVDREARELFITALLMAVPKEVLAPTPQLEVRTLDSTGFVVPPGWYGFIAAAGTGIIHRARMDVEVGMAALERLGAPESESRTPDFDGRRLVRVDGGYIALNYSRYREKDHTAADRSRRYRERKEASKTRGPAETMRQRIRRQVENDPITRADKAAMKKKWGPKAAAPEPEYDQFADAIASEGLPESIPL